MATHIRFLKDEDKWWPQKYNHSCFSDDGYTEDKVKPAASFRRQVKKANQVQQAPLPKLTLITMHQYAVLFKQLYSTLQNTLHSIPLVVVIIADALFRTDPNSWRTPCFTSRTGLFDKEGCNKSDHRMDIRPMHITNIALE